MEWLRKESIYFDAARKEWEAHAPQYIDGTFGWVGANSTSQYIVYSIPPGTFTTLPSHRPTILILEQAGRVRGAGVGGATRRTRRSFEHRHCRPRADLLHESEEGGICHRVCSRCVVGSLLREYKHTRSSSSSPAFFNTLPVHRIPTYSTTSCRFAFHNPRELTSNPLATATLSLQRREPREMGPRGIHTRAA